MGAGGEGCRRDGGEKFEWMRVARAALLYALSRRELLDAEISCIRRLRESEVYGTKRSRENATTSADSAARVRGRREN